MEIKGKSVYSPMRHFQHLSRGLQDQCSNHWAKEADTLVFKIDKINKQRNKKQKITVNRDNLTKKDINTRTK